MTLTKAAVLALGALVGGLILAAPAASRADAAAPKAVKATGWAARAEQMALAMLPKDSFNEAVGFFGPVAKRHLPTFQAFQREYLAAKEKLPVVAKYMPAAETAFAEAKAMRVPARFEAKKAEYVKMIEGFMGVLRMAMAVSGTPPAAPAK